MARILALTLGHNASALYYDSETGFLIGYEEERLTRRKNDSRFPINSLNRINRITHNVARTADQILVSHWFDRFDPTETTKYWNPGYFKPMIHKIKCVDHHEAHAWSAVAFYEQHARLVKECDVLVVDGFGNNQNCYSLFSYSPLNPTVLVREKSVYGYECSMGLMYQWAAEFVGMDGQADVYKFLGYRTHIEKGEHQEYLSGLADHIADIFLNRVFSLQNSGAGRLDVSHRDSKDLINYDDFAAVRKHTMQMFSELLPDKSSRADMGYVAQKVLETVITNLVAHWIPDRGDRTLLVAGGCFYNVRLNMILNESRESNFCPMPIAGDQGCGFGMIRSVNAHPNGLTRHFNISPRSQANKHYFMQMKAENLLFAPGDNPSGLIDTVVDYLKNDYIVNLVDGSSMEFGPRSLCHTSTLCAPTLMNVSIINDLNGRNTVMPMAPVMTRAWAYELFGDDIARTEGAEKFMIMAYRYKEGVVEKYGIEGAAHQDLDGTWSGRPQVVEQFGDHVIHGILFKLGWPCLINTSLNLHGEPICFGSASVRNLHDQWRQKNKKFVTIWVE